MQMQLRSEQLVINAIMTQPESIHGIMSKLTADMFHDMKNKLIFEVISSLYLERSPINLITIFKEAKQLNSIYKDEVAMEASRLQSAFTSVDRFSVPDAVDFLLAESIRNEHIDLGSKVKSLAESETYKPTDVINIIQEHITHNKYKSLANQKDFTNEQLLYELDNKMLNASMYQGISGIKTGYNRFDAVTSGMQPTNFIVVAARPAMGKELKNDSIIYTPNGKTTIGDIQIGDEVIGSNGEIYNVTGVFPQGMKDVYRVWFDDGVFVDCGLEHQWEVSTRSSRKSNKPPVVLTTKDMLDNVLIDGVRRNYSIRMCEPIKFTHSETVLDPYLLGVLIGDGSFSNTSIYFSNSEEDIINKVHSLIPDDCSMIYTGKYDYRIRGMNKYIRDLGLKMLKSEDKFIPKNYLYNSIETRIKLLQGLIDTDGYVISDKFNGIEYSTTSHNLCEDILELVRGLGGKATYSIKKGKYRKDGVLFEARDYYRMYLSLPPDIMPVSSVKHLKKYNNLKRYHKKFINKIEKIDEQQEMTCISVDAPDCLYLTNGCTLTHNTQYALGIMRSASIKEGKKGLFISCEMDEVQVMKRIIAMDAGIPGYSIKKGSLIPSERRRYEMSRQRIIDAPFKIVAGSFTISDVVSMVYKMKNAEGLDYVIIDYIQKITAPNAQNRTNEVGEVCRRLKDMANDLKIPIVGLAQLSRAVEHRVDKKPMLSDLRESGDIEQDADIVSFLYRPSYYMSDEDKENNPMSTDGYVIIAKHRDGEIEDIQLKFDPNIPAWMNPMDKPYEEEIYTQAAITPNTDFDEVPF